MTVEELIKSIERVIADAQSPDKITMPRLGPYAALEFIAAEIRHFKDESE